MARSREIRLETTQGLVAGLGWRREAAPRTLCLHGWLDNAASFIPLAPFMERLDLISIDLPGHGFSEHRHSSTRYHFIDYLFNIDATLDALGWSDCHLLGHSMGAAIAAVYSAGAPERVRSLTLLDTMGPISVSPEGTAKRLQRSLIKIRRGAGAPRKFNSIEEMVNARRQVSDLSRSAAHLICHRAAKRAGQHFEWRSDPALNWISSLVMSNEQALDLLRHIVAPAQTFTATFESPWSSRAKLEIRKEAIAHAQHHTLEGHHHFHMDEPEKIAETLQEFILDHDRSPEKRTS